MAREFADSLFFASPTFDMARALESARALRLLNTARPFVRAVPGGWLATVDSAAALRDPSGNDNYDFLNYRRCIKIGFLRENHHEA